MVVQKIVIQIIVQIIQFINNTWFAKKKIDKSTYTK